nr:cache domain-containing protein [Elusimicrobiales bacterium]
MNDKQEIAKSPESRRLAGLAAAFDAAAFSTGASSWPVTRRLLPPLAAMVLLLLAGAGGLLYRQHRQQLEKDIAADMSDTSGDLRVALEQQAAGLTMAIQPIAASPAVKKALRANDAAALLAVWRPVFEKMRRENQLTHFYFVNSNNVCLLRLHDPARRGDRLGHFTFLESGRTGRAASGIELGPLGTFTLRVVQPVFDGGKIIGYVELGEEIEKALHTLHTRSNNHLAVVIRKDLLKREAWEEGMRLLGRRADWDHLPGSVIVYASQGSLPGA